MCSKSAENWNKKSNTGAYDFTTKHFIIANEQPNFNNYIIIKISDIVSRIGNGILIDLGHISTRLYLVHNNSLKEKITLNFGGKAVTDVLMNEFSVNNRKVDTKSLYSNSSLVYNCIKEENCTFPINLNEKMSVKNVFFCLSYKKRNTVSKIGK